MFSSHLQANYAYTANLTCAPTSDRVIQDGAVSASNNAQCTSALLGATTSISTQYKIDATGGFLSAGGPPLLRSPI